ncbi:hypothetical protein [Cellulomonas pakistanensis]|uniref:Uncharacterized protein n=1 Tax=Cellulomonas pakistanensis TaxID=992287 RepID=A0A919PA94_9CELL|nr:hypothetical protein [Cellulomonas pakistanensis]GIG36478.1 hypothetical protein Cpa01nite_18590 [Cellulomonas pakistanensis]
MTFDQPQLALLLSRRAVLTDARSALPDAPQVPSRPPRGRRAHRAWTAVVRRRRR